MKKIILPNQTYFITTNVRHRQWVFAKRCGEDRNLRLRGWVTHHRVTADSHLRWCVPYEPTCQIAIRTLDFYRKKFGFRLHGFVLMPDHVHLLLTVGARGTISDIMRDWKSRIAFEVNRLDGKNVRGPLWQRDFWEHSIRNEQDFLEKLNYIHQNPVRAGYVNIAEEWKYSSARWYAGMPSCIEMDSD